MLLFYQQLKLGSTILLGYLPKSSISTQAYISLISSSAVPCSPSLRWGIWTELRSTGEQRMDLA